MKKLFWSLTLLLSLLLLTALAGCGEKETLYLLTVVFDAEKGAVRVTPVRDSNYFAKDTEITVKVTPFEGYEVAAFEVNGEAHGPQTEYSFPITRDTEISIGFAEAGGDGPTLSFPQAYRGTWLTYGASSSRTYTLEINGYSLKLTDAHLNVQALEVSAHEGGGYAVKWGERSCVLRAVAGAEYVLALEEGEETSFFLKQGEWGIAVPELFRGDYQAGTDLLTVGDAVTLNGREAVLVGGGEDHLSVLTDTLLRLDFAEDAVTVTPYRGEPSVYTKDTGPDLGVAFAPYWIGQWTALGGQRELTVTARSLSLGQETPASVRETAGGYAFDLGGIHYEATFYGLIPGVVLELRSGTAEPYGYEYFTAERHPVLGGEKTVEARYFREGTSMVWYPVSGDGDALEIAPHSVKYGNERAEYIIPTGKIESFKDPMSDWDIQVGAECYYLFFGEEKAFLYWDPDAASPILQTGGSILYFYDGVIRLPADWRGDWKGLSGDTVMTVEESAVRFDGADAQLRREGNAYTVLWEGARYALYPYPAVFEQGGEERTALLYLEEVSDGTEGGARLYFLNEILAERHAALDPVLNGTWRSEASGELTVAEGVPAWQGRAISVLFGTHEAGSSVYSYVLIIDGEISTLEYYGGIGIRVTVGLTTGTLFLRHEAVDKTSEGTVPKEFRGVYCDGITRAIVVEAEKITVYDETGSRLFAVSDTESAETVRVERKDGSVELYFTLETKDAGGGGIEPSSAAAAPAAEESVTLIRVRVTLTGDTAEWSEYGTQDGVPDYYPQNTLTKSGLF